jgi:hypothetical protein
LLCVLGAVRVRRISYAMPQPHDQQTLDRPALYRLAAAADCDVRTVERALRGEPLRGRVAEKLIPVLRTAGIEPPLPIPTTSSPTR